MNFQASQRTDNNTNHLMTLCLLKETKQSYATTPFIWTELRRHKICKEGQKTTNEYLYLIPGVYFHTEIPCDMHALKGSFNQTL